MTTQADIMEIAQDAGLLYCIDDEYLKRGDYTSQLTRFAAAIMEKCAKSCDDAAERERIVLVRLREEDAGGNDNYVRMMQAQDDAAAIRSMIQPPPGVNNEAR